MHEKRIPDNEKLGIKIAMEWYSDMIGKSFELQSFAKGRRKLVNSILFWH